MPGKKGKKPSKAEINALFQAYKEDRNPVIKGKIVDAYLDLVRSLARRFANRGEPIDDLVQVGSMGLLKAIDRFDQQLLCLAEIAPHAEQLPFRRKFLDAVVPCVRHVY